MEVNTADLVNISGDGHVSSLSFTGPPRVLHNKCSDRSLGSVTFLPSLEYNIVNEDNNYNITILIIMIMIIIIIIILLLYNFIQFTVLIYKYRQTNK